MKQKRYAIDYSTTVHYEAVLMAQNKTKAIQKVVDVIGKPVKIHSVYEIDLKDKNEK